MRANRISQLFDATSVNQVYIQCMSVRKTTALICLATFLSLIATAWSQTVNEGRSQRRSTTPLPQGTAKPKPPEEPSVVRVARLHYSGGGDWYWGNSALPNLLNFVRDNTDFPVDTAEKVVTIMDPDLFRYPFLYATGHGVISFSSEERERLRSYLDGGGFLFVNDSYGMARHFLKEMDELFPEREAVELPFDHEVYHCFFDFPNGPPKIHEHDNLPPRAYSIILNGRVVMFFLTESDIGDGWEDEQVHNDPPQKRLAALRMGVNLLAYALLN